MKMKKTFPSCGSGEGNFFEREVGIDSSPTFCDSYTYIPTKMCDYKEQVVHCPYNKFHMSLLGRMTKDMWKCHPMEHTRDLDSRH
jgi:hypothetical protein